MSFGPTPTPETPTTGWWFVHRNVRDEIVVLGPSMFTPDTLPPDYRHDLIGEFDHEPTDEEVRALTA